MKNPLKPQCKRGHTFEGANLIVRSHPLTTTGTVRVCRECVKLHRAKRRVRQKELDIRALEIARRL